MRQRGWVIGLFAGLVAALAGQAVASDNYRLINGTTDFYYGHVSLVDIKSDGKDPVVLREGATAAEPAALNLPLGPGDTLMTTDARRLEIQFDNGTTVRLDFATELKIETVMAQSLSARTKVTNLVLRKGRVYVMYKQYDSKEMFQIVGPNAAVKLAHNAVATIAAPAGGGTEIAVDFGRADVLYGPDPDKLIEKSVYKNETMTIDKSHAAGFGTLGAPSEFAAWNLDINKNFDELHKGKTMIPKPVQRLNNAVFYFAQQYGDLYGEWIYDDYFGYVWRPFMNNQTYPNGSWSPYFVGRWSEYNGQMFWVAAEPWGWVPYHLGVWHWDTKRGWYWIPGSAFAPAWVDWAFFGGGFFAWRPWSMWDWGCYFDGDNPFFGMYADGWFLSDWGGFWGWRYPWMSRAGYYVPPWSDGSYSPPVTKVSKGQLQKPGASPFDLPKELTHGLKALLGALKQGDAAAVESFRNMARQTMVIGAGDLHLDGLQNRVVRLGQFIGTAGLLNPASPQRTILSLPPRSAQNSVYNATRSYDQAARLARLLDSAAGQAAPSSDDVRPGPLGWVMKPGAAPMPGGAGAPMVRATTRARDWNPDIRIGIKSGVQIVYISQRNEISAPQLHISSPMASNRPILASDGTVRLGWNGRAGGGDGGYYSGGSYSSGGGSASSAGAGASSGGSASSGSSGGSSSSGGGGHIR